MKVNVRHIAKLANLPLQDSEIEKFQKQLSEVLEYVKKLDEVDTSKVEETSQVTNLTNVLGEDSVSESLTQFEALSQSFSSHEGSFLVKGILENE